MTCREVFYQMHADMDPEAAVKLFKDSCPDDFGYAEEPDYCVGCCGDDDLCAKCWSRESKTKCLGKMVDYKDVEGEGITMILEPIIKDSGNRREFESGAVRDMQEGKGRCDLMPLEVVAEYFRLGQYAPDPKRSEDYYWILWNIANFKNSDYTMTSYLYSAMGVFSSRFYDYDPTMFLEVAKHFEAGAKKYSEDNWKRGIPPKCYIDSAVRHFLKCCRGDEDEPHYRAFVWNLMCCIWEVDYHVKEEKA